MSDPIYNYKKGVGWSTVNDLEYIATDSHGKVWRVIDRQPDDNEYFLIYTVNEEDWHDGNTLLPKGPQEYIRTDIASWRTWGDFKGNHTLEPGELLCTVVPCD